MPFRSAARRYQRLLSLPDAGVPVVASALGCLAIGMAVLAIILLAREATVGSTLLDTVAPTGTATEAFAVMIMGIVAGNALGNALGGTLVDDASFETAVVCAGAIAAAGAGWVVVRR